MVAIHMFSTSNCPNCVPVKQHLDVLVANYPELSVSTTVVDKEDGGMLKAQEWNISAVPTLIFIQNATEVYRQVGALPMSTLEEYVKRYLGNSDEEENTSGI